MKAPWHSLYCLREDEILYAGWIAFQTNEEIIAALAKEGFIRTVKGIQCRRRALGISNLITKRDTPFEALDRDYGQPGPQGTHDERRYETAGLVRADHAFKNAMLKALRNGEEFAVLGVVRDNRPFALKTIHAEPASSIYGSTAAACVDA